MKMRSAFAAVFALTIAVPMRAAAQAPPPAPAPSDQLEAIAEFTAGRVLFEAGDCAGAIPHFVASLKRAQSVGARFNLAECSARERREAEAFNHYKAAEQLAIAKADNPRAQLARAAAAQLERRVTMLRVVLPPGEVVSFMIDGVAVEAADQWQLATGYALEPGTPHTLVAEASGKARWERRDVSGDVGVELPPVFVEFKASEKSQGPEKPPEGSSSNPLRTTALITGGVGVAVLATGGVFVLLASSAKSDAESACGSGAGFSYPAMCNPMRRGDVTAANDSAKSDATLATVAFVVGAVLVSTAVVLFFASGSKPTSGVARALAVGSF